MDSEQKQALRLLHEDMSEDNLWRVVILFQNYPFQTLRGLPFSYQLKVGRNGNYNKELIISRRKESKTLVFSSVRLAFNKAKDMRTRIITRPKQIGDIRGISYIYPMLLEWGIIKNSD